MRRKAKNEYINIINGPKATTLRPAETQLTYSTFFNATSIGIFFILKKSIIETNAYPTRR